LLSPSTPFRRPGSCCRTYRLFESTALADWPS
jgi:hypothetical protein